MSMYLEEKTCDTNLSFEDKIPLIHYLMHMLRLQDAYLLILMRETRMFGSLTTVLVHQPGSWRTRNTQ